MAPAERERLRTMARQSFQQFVTHYLAGAEYETGLIYARRLLVMDPWIEETHCQLMRLLASSG
jgi:two-component SAPR family response regulator